MTEDGGHIRCDGENEGKDCGAIALSTAEGWLFVARYGRWRHFCPRCAPRILSLLEIRLQSVSCDLFDPPG